MDDLASIFERYESIRSRLPLASFEGEPMTVAFNPDYLAAGVDAVDGDEVRLAVVDPMKPAVLRGVGHDEYLYLLMPVRVP